MRLTFIGADHEVTGSCSLIEVEGHNILIDCGMEQGPNIYEQQVCPVAAPKIDAVFLTHAHIDHSGLLPLLYKNGFRGKIYLTRATKQLCNIMLLDSAHIQEFEAEWRNRKAKRAGKNVYTPIYTSKEANSVLNLFKACDYNDRIQVFKNVAITFIDAGHLLGSSSIKIELTEKDVTKTIVFSGDIGNKNKPIIRDPEYIDSADYVVMESTYGDRSHGDKPDYVNDLAKIIQDTLDRGGNLVIPSFAVGRTQELLYFIREIKEQNLIKGHPSFPVYIDSPMAVESTKVFANRDECFDDATLALINKGINPIDFDGLKMSITADDSKMINFDKTPKVILSASGMCEAGRIRHHLKHNLWLKESTILFVGYQVPGTLGRRLLDGETEVTLFGEKIQVNAKILKLANISSHADVDGLMEWINNYKEKPKHVFVNHGDDMVCEVFAQRLRDNGFNAEAPYSGDEWDLITNECTKRGSRALKVKEDGSSIAVAKTPGQIKRLSYINEANSLIRDLSNSINDYMDNSTNEDLRKLIAQMKELVSDIKKSE